MNMIGKIVLVTGSNSGIGKETALGLAKSGATLVMAVRNREAGERARAEIIEKTGNQDVDLLVADLSSMAEVRALASEFKEKHEMLHVLVNNAGGIFPERKVTVDGLEMTLALNYLAPVLLTHELLGVLARSTPSRIVNVSSGAHSFGKVDFSNLQSPKYGSMRAYGNAKLMNIMFTYALSRRLEGSGITANALHPGVVRTNFGHNGAGFGRRAAFKMLGAFSKSPAQGAETSIYLASSPEVEGMSGAYFADSKPRVSSKASYDLDTQEQLWNVTLEMLGVQEDGFDVTKTHATEARQDLS